jgi:SAM-dependent methyltransferase
VAEGLTLLAVDRCWCGGDLEPWEPDFPAYARCASCGCRSVTFHASPESLARFYAVDYWYEYQAIHGCPPIEERWERDLLDRIPQYLEWIQGVFPPPARVLEVGCGSGRLLKELKDRGYTCAGSDMDPRVAEFARVRTGLPVEPGAFPRAPRGETDIVLLIDILEHIPDPDRFLEIAASFLAGGGKLLVHLPVIDSPEEARRQAHLFNPLSHLWMHTSGSLVLLASRHGLVAKVVGRLFDLPFYILERRAGAG